MASDMTGRETTGGGEAQAASLVPEGYNPTKKIRRFVIHARQRFLDEHELGRYGISLGDEPFDKSLYAAASVAAELLAQRRC